VSALLDGNSDYQAVTVMKVEWDKFRDDPITKALDVRRQSTLIMFRDGAEIDRLIAGTSKEAIEALFIKAVS